MRVFCVCLCLLALTSTIYGDDDAAASPTTAAPAPAPAGGAAQETSTTVDSTTTQTPTTPEITRTFQGEKGQTIHHWLDAGETYDSSITVSCDTANAKYLNPTDYQRTNECEMNKNVVNLKDDEEDGFVYVKKDGAEEKYQCCIDPRKICPGDRSNGADRDPDVHNNKFVRCENDNFKCTIGKVCHKQLDKTQDKAVQDYFTSKLKNMPAKYSIGDICCPNIVPPSTVCDVSKKPHIRDIQSTNNECEKKKGRCSDKGKYGVCSQPEYAPDFTASCCEVPDEHLCPGRLLPFGFRIIEEHNDDYYKEHHAAFDFLFKNFTKDDVKKARSKECEDIKEHGGAYLYPKDEPKQCCPVAEIAANDYVLNQNNANYNKYSKEPCDTGNECSDASLYCAPARDPTSEDKSTKGRMCFPRMVCPHVQDTKKVYSNPKAKSDDLNCDVGSEGQCADGDVCMSTLNGTLGVCCSATAYSYKCKGADGGPEAKGDGVAVQKAQCVNDPDDKYVHKSVTIEGNVKICCRWNKAGSAPGPQGTPPSVPPGFTGSLPTVKPTASSGECQNNGKYILDNEKLPKECGAGAKEAGRCEGHGVCRKSSRNQKLYCCDENRCPTDNFTPMDGLGKCDESDGCKQLSPLLKDKYCKKDKNGDSKCCPIPAANGKGVHRDIKENKIKSFALTGTKCKDVDDCGGHGKYCKDNVCWNYGSNSVANKVNCNSNDDCKKDGQITYHCLKMGAPNDHGTCAHHTRVDPPKKFAIKLGYVIGAITNAIFAIIFGLLAVVMFLKYRSKNFCDQRKPSKKDKKKSKKSEKTETTGGDTTGGTTSKADK